MSSRPVDVVLTRLDKCKPSGKGRWNACCPAHIDKSPSLGIKEAENGDVLLYCRAGCDTQDVVAAIGLKMGDLFAGSLNPEVRAQHKRKAAEAEFAQEALIATIGENLIERGEQLSDADMQRLIEAQTRKESLAHQLRKPANSIEAVQMLAQAGVYVDCNMRQEPYANLANACAVLRDHPMFAGKIWYDTFHQEIMTTWDCDRPRKWVDADRLQLTEIFQRDFGLVKFGDETIEKAAISVAQHDQRDSLADWLRGLSWDGVPRLNGWLVNAVGASRDLYHDAVGANFLRSLVARGLMPGSKVDTMPVFEGPQGSNKSTMLSVLGGEYYAELTESLETKDFFVVIQGKWLVEIGELNAMRKADVSRIKQILSSSQDRCRLPYAKRAIDLPRRVVFAGTTNEHEYLRDSTGARRFWPISIERIDLNWLRANREQLFAEAVNQVLEGATWWEVPTEEANAQTEDRRETDVWEAKIEEKFGHQSKLTTSEVLEGLGFEFSRMTQADQARAGKALKAIGFVRKKMRFPSNPVAVWGFERKSVRPRPPTDAPF